MPRARRVLAERVSGVGSVAHALAFCQAVEAGRRLRGAATRALLRVAAGRARTLYNHLHYLGHLCRHDHAQGRRGRGQAARGARQADQCRLTGSRFLRSVLVPGGLRRDLEPEHWLGGEARCAARQMARHMSRDSSAPNSHLDRLITTGVLQQQVAFDQGATGPIERASGVDRDLRRDHHMRPTATRRSTVPVAPTATPMRGARCALPRSRPALRCSSECCCCLPAARCVPTAAAATRRGARLGGIAARLAVLCRAFRRRRPPRARQDQVAVLLELAGIPVHRARQQHDGLRDQRGELRPHHRGLRPIERPPCRYGHLFGLSEGKATTPGRSRRGKTVRTACSACRAIDAASVCADGCDACADVCPTGAIAVDGAQTDRRRPARRRLRPLRRLPALRRSVPGRRHERHRPTGPSACASARICVWAHTPHRPRKAPARPRARFRRSLHVRHVDAGSCNGCESELQALNNPFYNLHRLGIFFTPSPRFADLLLVTGPVTYAMREPLRRAYEAMPEPRWVMAVGTCAVSGGDRRWRLRVRQRARRRAAGRRLSARLPAESGGDHPALLMFLDRAPQRVKGGQLGDELLPRRCRLWLAGARRAIRTRLLGLLARCCAWRSPAIVACIVGVAGRHNGGRLASRSAGRGSLFRAPAGGTVAYRFRSRLRRRSPAGLERLGRRQASWCRRRGSA